MMIIIIIIIYKYICYMREGDRGGSTFRTASCGSMNWVQMEFLYTQGG